MTDFSDIFEVLFSLSFGIVSSSRDFAQIWHHWIWMWQRELRGIYCLLCAVFE